MGITRYFLIFEHNKKLHVHYGLCCDGEVSPWFISKDDVDYHYKTEPKNVTGADCDLAHCISIHKSCPDDYFRLMVHMDCILSNRDYKYFKQKYNKLHGYNRTKEFENYNDYSDFSDFTYDEWE